VSSGKLKLKIKKLAGAYEKLALIEIKLVRRTNRIN